MTDRTLILIVVIVLCFVVTTQHDRIDALEQQIQKAVDLP